MKKWQQGGIAVSMMGVTSMIWNNIYTYLFPFEHVWYWHRTISMLKDPHLEPSFPGEYIEIEDNGESGILGHNTSFIIHLN